MVKEFVLVNVFEVNDKNIRTRSIDFGFVS